MNRRPPPISKVIFYAPLRLYPMKNNLSIFILLVFSAKTPFAQTYKAGNTYLGRNNYTEYRAGSLPIIITAPHGGRLEPTTIPDRTCATCTTVMDANTMELAYQIDTALQQVFGCFPHIIVNRLHRIKMDANREIVEAAGGSPDAETAWREWHQYIQAAKDSIVRRYGRGLLIDLHGHGHTIQRLEIGYLLDGSELRLSDSVLSTPQYRDQLSIKNLVLNNLNNFNASQILRGPFALGTLLGANNFPSVPSQQDVAPMVNDLYFNGGYNTLRHGSRDSTKVDALQIECNFTGVRNTFTTRQVFANQLAMTLKTYLSKHYFSSTNFGCRTPIQDVNAVQMCIFPNPAKQALTIHFDKNEQNRYQLQLYNMLGQSVFQENIAPTETVTVALPPLSIGTYFLTLRNEKGELVGRSKVFIE